MSVDLFPFQQYWWFYAAFTAFVLLLLALDLGLVPRDAREVRFREAATWSAVWVSLALAFNYGLYQYSLWKFAQDPRLLALPGFNPTAAAEQVGLEFLTGYLVEKALALGSGFGFVLHVVGDDLLPPTRDGVLFYGIIG